MSKEEYANEIKKLAYHYNKGKEDERNRILKLIDEKIKVIETLGDKYSFNHDSIIRTLQELKEQLKK